MPILALATREAREAVRARMPAFTESATSSGENDYGNGKINSTRSGASAENYAKTQHHVKMFPGGKLKTWG